MAKVITFSRFFPKNHINGGGRTNFAEQIFNSLNIRYWVKLKYLDLDDLNSNTDFKNDDVWEFHHLLDRGIENKKNHTIRNGNRFKKGDFFSPRVWSGKPYQSKQIILSKDIEIVNVWDIRILVQDFGKLGLQAVITINGQDFQNIELLAKNDGLSVDDFLQWFKTEKGETFVGQIICWNDAVSY